MGPSHASATSSASVIVLSTRHSMSALRNTEALVQSVASASCVTDRETCAMNQKIMNGRSARRLLDRPVTVFSPSMTPFAMYACRRTGRARSIYRRARHWCRVRTPFFRLGSMEKAVEISGGRLRQDCTKGGTSGTSLRGRIRDELLILVRDDHPCAAPADQQTIDIPTRQQPRT